MSHGPSESLLSDAWTFGNSSHQATPGTGVKLTGISFNGSGLHAARQSNPNPVLLKDASLEVRNGEILCVLGAKLSGKSALLAIIRQAHPLLLCAHVFICVCGNVTRVTVVWMRRLLAL